MDWAFYFNWNNTWIMKVGLLGGSFNPPHQGHIHISNLAAKKLNLNQVWWIPTAHNPLKEKSIYAPYFERFKKCEALTRSCPKIYIKKYDEIYTVKLLTRLQKQYPAIDFFWIAGADNLENLHKWDRYQKIINSIPLVVFSRGTFLRRMRQTKVWKFITSSKAQFFYTKNLDISSTEIRKTNA